MGDIDYVVEQCRECFGMKWCPFFLDIDHLEWLTENLLDKQDDCKLKEAFEQSHRGWVKVGEANV